LIQQVYFLPFYKNGQEIVVVLPDIGGIARACNFCSLFGKDLAVINKSCDKKEKSALGKNAANLVRQCAADVGKKMSWSQAWESLKDIVSDIVGSLIHSDNPIKKIIAQHPKEHNIFWIYIW